MCVWRVWKVTGSNFYCKWFFKGQATWTAWPSTMRPKCVRNVCSSYHQTLCNIPQERRPTLPQRLPEISLRTVTPSAEWNVNLDIKRMSLSSIDGSNIMLLTTDICREKYYSSSWTTNFVHPFFARFIPGSYCSFAIFETSAGAN